MMCKHNDIDDARVCTDGVFVREGVREGVRVGVRVGVRGWGDGGKQQQPTLVSWSARQRE